MSKIPSGFDWNAVVDGRPLFVEPPTVKTKFPTWKEVKQSGFETLFVVRPSDLLQHKITGTVLPGAREARIASVKQAWKTGQGLAPIEMLIDRKGNLWVEDGNHRLQAAAELGDRPVAIKFRAANSLIDYGDEIRPKIKQALSTKQLQGVSRHTSCVEVRALWKRLSRSARTPELKRKLNACRLSPKNVR